MKISSRLREVLASKGLTFAELSRRSGVSHSTVYAASRGAVPGQGARERIANALGVPSAALWPADGTAARPLALDASQGR